MDSTTKFKRCMMGLVSGDTFMNWRWFSTAIVVAFISGCTTDYLNNYDSVTFAAGDADRSNMLLQTVDPFNPNSQNTRIEGDGARAVAVFNGYRGATRARSADLDCAGGSGNNAVVAPGMQITGSDPNRLDGDRDGIGCEGK
ncbi:calcium-binding protein [Mesorhizobium sp. WSM1293]|uniref:calcium-binding protein n=1 Tax=Mesorhizobium sp. WSM1293 TaxID=1040984 RepID=UPI001FDA5E29|nr:calcium-binding protein [Mesorhizobium sp. WSM1293]